MAYALIAWSKPGATPQELAAIEADFAKRGALPFFRGLFLYPEDGPRWKEMMDFAFSGVKAHPGLEAVVIMPEKGARVGGWVSAKLPKDGAAMVRKIMNEGEALWPKLLKPPKSAPPADWNASENWQDEEE